MRARTNARALSARATAERTMFSLFSAMFSQCYRRSTCIWLAAHDNFKKVHFEVEIQLCISIGCTILRQVAMLLKNAVSRLFYDPSFKASSFFYSGLYTSKSNKKPKKAIKSNCRLIWRSSLSFVWFMEYSIKAGLWPTWCTKKEKAISE